MPYSILTAAGFPLGKAKPPAAGGYRMSVWAFQASSQRLHMRALRCHSAPRGRQLSLDVAEAGNEVVKRRVVAVGEVVGDVEAVLPVPGAALERHAAFRQKHPAAHVVVPECTRARNSSGEGGFRECRQLPPPTAMPRTRQAEANASRLKPKGHSLSCLTCRIGNYGPIWQP
jgi:hypothetical protein